MFDASRVFSGRSPTHYPNAWDGTGYYGTFSEGFEKDKYDKIYLSF